MSKFVRILLAVVGIAGHREPELRAGGAGGDAGASSPSAPVSASESRRSGSVSVRAAPRPRRWRASAAIRTRPTGSSCR